MYTVVDHELISQLFIGDTTMVNTSQHTASNSGSPHAVLAACLSAAVMIAILLAPTVASAIGNYQITPDQPVDQSEYVSLDNQIATGYYGP